MKNEFYVVGWYTNGRWEDWPEYQYCFYTDKDTAWIAFKQVCHDIWDSRSRKNSWNEEMIKDEKEEWFNNSDKYKNNYLEDEDMNYIWWSFKGTESEARIMVMTIE